MFDSLLTYSQQTMCEQSHVPLCIQTHVSQVVQLNYLFHNKCSMHLQMHTNLTDSHFTAVPATLQPDLMHMHQIATHDQVMWLYITWTVTQHCLMAQMSQWIVLS